MTETAKNAVKKETVVKEVKAEPKPKLPDISYNAEDFTVMKQFEDNRGLYEKRVNKPEFDNHTGKCNHRACKEFGVSLDHLKYCYEILNGRVIDGYQIVDMIERYGFMGAPNVNRQALVTLYNEINKTNKTVQALKVSFMKLKTIVQDHKPLEKFMKYQKEYEDALLKERRDEVVDGR